MAGKNQLLDNMLCAAKARLEGRCPRDIARNAGVQFDGEAFCFVSLGREVRVSYPDFDVQPELPHWHMLTLLHYLDLADGTLLSGRQMPFSAYRSGMVRGGGFDRDAEAVIRDKLGVMAEDQLKQRCLALGAQIIPSNADLCVRMDFAPGYPLWLKLWFADDEFPASGRMFVDESADHYLSIEDAVTAGSLVLEYLCTGE